MAGKTVVGEDAAQVRVIGEQDAVKIEGFALVPVGGGEHRDDGGDGRVLVGLELHTDAAVLVGRQQMIDDVEALLAVGVVHAADVDEADETAIGIVAEEFKDADDVGGLRPDRQLAVFHLEARHRASKAGGDVLAQFLQGLSHHQRSIVPVRRIFFCS